MRILVFVLLSFLSLAVQAQNTGSVDSTQTITLPESIVIEIEALQKNAQPVVEQINALKMKVRELELQLQAAESGINGQVKGYLAGKGVDVKGKAYSLSADGKSVVIRNEKSKQ